MLYGASGVSLFRYSTKSSTILVDPVGRFGDWFGVTVIATYFGCEK